MFLGHSKGRIMRFFKGLAGLRLATGLSLTGAAWVVGCGEDFDGCEASRTCKGKSAGSSGMGGMAGAGASGAGEAASSSGRGGSASGGKSGAASGGRSGSATGDAGDGGAGAATGSAGEAGSAPANAGTTSSGTGGSSGEAGSDSGPSGDAPPHIVATSPANSAKGVLSDVIITVTFSEPMDNETTQHAYSSTDLPDVMLSWQENNTKLVIRPKDPLVYASVDSLDGDAKHYSFTIAGTATSLSGKALGDDRNYGFTTMRQIRATRGLRNRSYGMVLYHPNDGDADYMKLPCDTDADRLDVGDTAENTALAAVASFYISDLPEGVLEWTSARVRGSFTTSERNPFSRLGDLTAHNVVGELRSFDWDSEPVEDFGVAAHYPSMEVFNVNVLDAVKREYEHRDERPFSVLFRFEDGTDDDDLAAVAHIQCEGLLLDFSITAP